MKATLFDQKEMIVWKSKNGWTAAKIVNGILVYVEAKTQRMAIAALKKMVQ